MALSKPSNVELRAMDPSEVDSLAQMWVETRLSLPFERAMSILTTKEACLDRINQGLSDGWDVTLALEPRSNTILGFCAILPKEGLLDQLFIRANLQGRGIGKLLFERARSQMPNGFQLRALEENQDARGFYEHFGMKYIRAELHPKHGYRTVIYAWP